MSLRTLIAIGVAVAVCVVAVPAAVAGDLFDYSDTLTGSSGDSLTFGARVPLPVFQSLAGGAYGPVGDVSCSVRRKVVGSPGSSYLGYSGTNGCQTILAHMMGETQLEHPANTIVSFGSDLNCALCQVGGSSGDYYDAHPGWTYYYDFWDQLSLVPGAVWTYMPSACFGSGTEVAYCDFRMAFNAP
jgi:hypothetical protein